LLKREAIKVNWSVDNMNIRASKPVPPPAPTPPIKIVGDSMPKGLGSNKSK